MEDKILTLHPQEKHGVNILKRKYTVLKNFILKTIRQRKEITFEEFCDLAEDALTNSFDGKVLWYLVTVNLDLEARGLIERILKTSPYKLRIKHNS